MPLHDELYIMTREGPARAIHVEHYVSRLEDALRPFAAERERRPWMPEVPTPQSDGMPIGGNDITHGDIRRAHEVLSNSGAERMPRHIIFACNADQHKIAFPRFCA